MLYICTLYLLNFFTIDSVTCQTRCLVTVAVIDFNKNKLEGVGLRFENESYEYSPCTCLSNSFAHGVNIDIYCPAWNTGKYILHDLKLINNAYTVISKGCSVRPFQAFYYIFPTHFQIFNRLSIFSSIHTKTNCDAYM